MIKDGSKERYSDGQVLKFQAKSGAAFLYFYSDKHYVEDGFRIRYRWAVVHVHYVAHMYIILKV